LITENARALEIQIPFRTFVTPLAIRQVRVTQMTWKNPHFKRAGVD
jgi:hypothetical protein